MRRNVRVKLSRKAMTDGLGGKRRNRLPRLEGTIISPSLPEQQIVTVLWDGRTNLKAGTWTSWRRFQRRMSVEPNRGPREQAMADFTAQWSG